MNIWMPPVEYRLHGPCEGDDDRLEGTHFHFYCEWDNSADDQPNVVVVGLLTTPELKHIVHEEYSQQITQRLRDEFEQNKIIEKLARETAQAIVDGRLRVPPEMVEIAQRILDGEGEAANIPLESLGNILQGGAERIESKRSKEEDDKLTTGMYL